MLGVLGSLLRLRSSSVRKCVRWWSARSIAAKAVRQEGAAAGTLHVTTEFGRMDVPPGHICVVQCGMRLSVGLGAQESVHGYVLEVYGHHWQLPELGPIGAAPPASPAPQLAALGCLAWPYWGRRGAELPAVGSPRVAAWLRADSTGLPAGQGSSADLGAWRRRQRPGQPA